MDSLLKKEFEYYRASQDELVKQYDGKFVAIKDQKAIGAYDDQLVAVEETEKAGHALGTFLFKKLKKGKRRTHKHSIPESPLADFMSCGQVDFEHSHDQIEDKMIDDIDDRKS
jgi:hypothetical protein